MATPPHPNSDMKIVHDLLVDIGRTQKRMETRLCRLMNQHGLDEFGTPLAQPVFATAPGRTYLPGPADAQSFRSPS